MKKGFLAVIMFGLCLALAPSAPAVQPAEDQTAHMAVGVDDIGTLDPNVASKIGEVPIIQLVYESLLRHPPGAIDNKRLQPSLAVKWEVGEDKLTWTFHLRKGVQWHEDFGEFTAEDVKFSIDRILDPEAGMPVRKNLAAIDSVSIVDKHSVQFNDLPAKAGRLLWA